jgi:hypothetical protein
MRVQTVAGIVSLGALLFGFGEVAMSQTSQLGNVRNVVLVHGGWVDGSGWEGVYNVHLSFSTTPTSVIRQ